MVVAASGLQRWLLLLASCRFDDDGLKSLQYLILVAKRRRGHSQGRYFPTLVYFGTALMLEKYRNIRQPQDPQPTEKKTPAETP
jgi:hypothetical protein